MTIKETCNIHNTINCVFPNFKSKWLCKKGIHNYMLMEEHTIIPKIIKNKDSIIQKNELNAKCFWKCYCCGDIKNFTEE